MVVQGFCTVLKGRFGIAFEGETWSFEERFEGVGGGSEGRRKVSGEVLGTLKRCLRCFESGLGGVLRRATWSRRILSWFSMVWGALSCKARSGNPSENPSPFDP